MKIYTRELDWNGGETAIAFGMFDGVHLGHRKLIETTCREAEKRGLTSMVFTFSNHPLSIIAPDRIPPQLNTEEEKLTDLESCGVSSVLLRTFDREFADLSADAFIHRIVKTLHPRVFVIGFNYTFGARGCGRAEDMRELGRELGIDTCIVDRVQLEGETVSSSRIRAALAEGNAALANTMLGHPYRITGTVERGKHLGRTLGFPTANLAFPSTKLIPKYGVYACRARIGNTSYAAAVNVGKHPTVPEGKPTIEAFLIDYPGMSIYNETLTLEFLHFIRPERRFESLEALTEEVLANCRQAAELLAAEHNF